ncbi:hypothetical protein ABZ383_21165 [Streptomyces sp. NPDC005900]|uniref:hypothetical protein n=1 Tax=Streptomyces sp. NPDC005900 TaxID=3154569 RepID=UPI0033F7DBFC
MNSKDLFDRYEEALRPVRAEQAADPDLELLTSQDCPEQLFFLWNLRWTAHGVRMAEPVPKLLRDVGKRWGEVGQPTLAKKYEAHGSEEIGHDDLMASDARVLAERWNESARVPIDVEALIDSPALPSVQRFHGWLRTGDLLFYEAAILYEIERLSISFLPLLIDRCRETLPRGGYGFLEEHLEVDQGHVEGAAAGVRAVLNLDASDLPALIAAGSFALPAYCDLFRECLALAKKDFERETTTPLGIVP